MIKTILCFGDSNVFGTSHDGGLRYGSRWPVLLQTLLGSDARVVEEGLAGRALITKTEHRNGLEHLRISLESHRPLDVCLVMLGTADSKTINRVDSAVFIQGVETAIDYVSSFGCYRNSSNTRVIWVFPPRIGDYTKAQRGSDYDDNSFQWLEEIKLCLKEFFKTKGIPYIENDDLLVGSDGLHLTQESHKVLADKVAQAINSL